MSVVVSIALSQKCFRGFHVHSRRRYTSVFLECFRNATRSNSRSEYGRHRGHTHDRRKLFHYCHVERLRSTTSTGKRELDNRRHSIVGHCDGRHYDTVFGEQNGEFMVQLMSAYLGLNMIRKTHCSFFLPTKKPTKLVPLGAFQ